ncbi:hypothetical protein BD410DRAFT_788723 [Rickenella mellea]|uniref:Secreted protein n=1 Tax=Rickenella mellea TaxID=50990 RepID=A0A4Y7Q6E1_9AGAM|nr:hypothetical protein BD410DRAFT_788723 [Rickenella mellea]
MSSCGRTLLVLWSPVLSNLAPANVPRLLWTSVTHLRFVQPLISQIRNENGFDLQYAATLTSSTNAVAINVQHVLRCWVLTDRVKVFWTTRRTPFLKLFHHSGKTALVIHQIVTLPQVDRLTF